MISIIVPAHNEEAVIAGGLRAILVGAEPGEVEVIVACNGCTDRTAEIARLFGAPVQVIELPQASKISALNAGDAAAKGFPRFFVDADVVIDLSSIRLIARALENARMHFATPTLTMNTSRSPWLVRAYYRVWTQLPYNKIGGQVGTGVYAVSREGRGRFSRFPEVINDDGFVRFMFAPEERGAVMGAVSYVCGPQSLAALIRAKTRVRAGHIQLADRMRLNLSSDRDAAPPLWRWAFRHPELWLLIPVYLVINLVIRRLSANRLRNQVVKWGRDDSRIESRINGASTSPPVNKVI